MADLTRKDTNIQHDSAPEDGPVVQGQVTEEPVSPEGETPVPPNDHSVDAADADQQKQSTDTGSLAQGYLVGGKYRIISLLGRGGMGAVYRVEQVFLKKELALKALESCVATGSAHDLLVRRFQMEARAASALNHPNLVQVHDFGLFDNGRPYLVMDLVEGRSLAEILQQDGALNLEQIEAIFTQVCLGLSYAHDQGVVHRDIKPSNIMLVSSRSAGQEGSVKIVDFGIAKVVGHEGGEIQALTRTGEIFGSPLYMSPEQCSGDTVDHRSDIYSLGCVLFEALTGTPPHLGLNALRTMMLHQSESAPRLREASLGSQFPEALEQTVSRMLRKLPSERYQDLRAVARDLVAGCSGRTIQTHPSKSRAGSKKTSESLSITARQLYLYLALTAVIAATATVLAMQFMQQMHSRSAPRVSADQSMSERQKASGTKFDDSPLMTTGFTADNWQKWNSKIDHMRATFDKAGPIASTIVIHGGVKQKQFEFPACPIGLLSNRSIRDFPDGANRSTHVERPAQDRVFAPIGMPLTLEVDPFISEALLAPEVFDKIDPSEFSGLYITQPLVDEASDIGAMDSRDPKSAKLANDGREGTLHLLQTATRWTNLRTLGLSALPENEAQSRALNNFRNLRHLRISHLAVDPIEIARQPFLSRMEAVALVNVQADPIVNRLAGSHNLKSLVLESSPVSASTIKQLRNCPNLSYLQLGGQKNIDDQTVNAVTEITSLRTVFFKGIELSQEQVATLDRCRWINQIRLSTNNTSNAAHVKAVGSSKFRIVAD